MFKKNNGWHTRRYTLATYTLAVEEKLFALVLPYVG